MNKIQVTTVFTRFSESNKFYQTSTDDVQYIRDTYIKTGKILKRESYMSSDKMAKTVVTHFASTDAWNEFSADPVQLKIIQDRNELNVQNNIRTSLIMQEYNDDGIVNSETRTIT